MTLWIFLQTLIVFIKKKVFMVNNPGKEHEFPG